jgi:hypothetical protein
MRLGGKSIGMFFSRGVDDDRSGKTPLRSRIADFHVASLQNNRCIGRVVTMVCHRRFGAMAGLIDGSGPREAFHDGVITGIAARGPPRDSRISGPEYP